MPTARVQVSIKNWANIDSQLSQLPIAVRGTELEKAIRKGIGMVSKRAKQLVPPPGYPGDKPGLKPLRETLGTVLRRYKNGMIIAGVAGPEYPAGAHGHLVEHGTAPHAITTTKKTLIDKGGKNFVMLNALSGGIPLGKTVDHPGAKSHPYMEPAAAESEPQIEGTIIAALQKAASKKYG